MKTWLSIQYLRAVAALAVVHLHAYVELQKSGDLSATSWFQGDLGVDLFFVISGFIIWMTTDNDRSRPMAFWWRRIVRVVPLYWLCTLALVVLLAVMPTLFNQSHLEFWHVVRSLLFIPHEDPFEPGMIFPILQVGWTLNYEMFFYACFGVALLLPARLRAIAVCAWLGALVTAGAIFKPENALLATYTNPLLLEFMAGMLIGYACKRLPSPPPIAGYGLVILALASYAVLNFGLDITPMDWRVLCWGLPAALLVAGLVIIERQTPVRHLTVPHLLGDASFAIYLSHPFTLGVLGWAWGRLELGSVFTADVFVVIAMLICALGGVLLHLLAERPLTALMRNRPLPKLAFGMRDRQPTTDNVRPSDRPVADNI